MLTEFLNSKVDDLTHDLPELFLDEISGQDDICGQNTIKIFLNFKREAEKETFDHVAKVQEIVVKIQK